MLNQHMLTRHVTLYSRIVELSFWDWVYRYFEKPGRKVLSIYRNLPDTIRRSGIHIHPEVYASFTMFVTLIVTAITVLLGVLFFNMGLYLIIPVLVMVPFLTFVIVVHIPALIGSSRAGGIEGEIPYTTSYLSMLVISGLSPYIAFERIVRASRIFVKSSELAQRFILLVRVFGRDPLTAFSAISTRTPSATVKDLLAGYVTTVRAGGDVVDYLTKKARLLFSELLVKIKIVADRLAGILEAYLALVLLTLISLTVMYFITTSYAGALTFGISSSGMFLFLYIMLPMISGMIIYLTDIMQYKEPWIDYRPYIMFFGLTVPLTAFLVVFGMVLPSVLPPGHPLRESILTKSINEFLLLLATLFNLPRYTHYSIALATALVTATLPTVIYTGIVSREHKIVQGITRFLRDLVEVRKTGMSPEKSIVELSKRDYGVFSKYLKSIAMQLSLGIPLSRIIEGLFNKIIVWRAKVMLYILTDSIEVGGGSIEVMENLAWFAESVESIEEERKRSLRTLLIVPYMGAILASITVILMAAFMGSLQFGAGGAYYQAASTALPAIVINTYFMGLVAGKVSSGSVAAGFKHAVILTLITILVFLLTPTFELTLGGMLQSPV
ncbi:MAG: type II secretion system F family protein [Thermoprotei archaeon]